MNDFHGCDNLGLEPTTPRQVTYQNGWPVPAGWKLVPEEPNGSMLDAGAREVDWYHHNADACYRAMLDAAPTPPAQASGKVPAASAEPVATVNRSTVIEWLDALDIEVTDKQLDGLFHAAQAIGQAPAAAGDAWEAAIDRELVTLQSTADSYASPSEAVRAMLDWHVSVERDPAVSEMAQDAARYRLIRDLGASFSDYDEREYCVCEDAMDSALDRIRAAMQRTSGGDHE